MNALCICIYLYILFLALLTFATICYPCPCSPNNDYVTVCASEYTYMLFVGVSVNFVLFAGVGVCLSLHQNYERTHSQKWKTQTPPIASSTHPRTQTTKTETLEWLRHSQVNTLLSQIDLRQIWANSGENSEPTPLKWATTIAVLFSTERNVLNRAPGNFRLLLPSKSTSTCCNMLDVAPPSTFTSDRSPHPDEIPSIGQHHKFNRPHLLYHSNYLHFSFLCCNILLFNNFSFSGDGVSGRSPFVGFGWVVSCLPLGFFGFFPSF